jgi:hypothetical protein
MREDFAGVRLELARQREQGAPFPVAWSRGLEQLPPITGRTVEAVERRQTRDALLDTREVWQAAYELRPATQGAESVVLR